MGRTTPTTTELLRREIEAWKPFRAMLPKKDRKEFDAMLQSAQLYRYAMMMSLPQHPIPFRPILMSIIFRHYQQLEVIKKELDNT